MKVAQLYHNSFHPHGQRSPSGFSSGKNTGESCHFLLQGIFLTQGSTLLQTQVCCVGGRFFTSEPPGKPQTQHKG